MRRLLLDTNVLVWLLLGERESVSEPARTELEDERNTLSVSAVSIWEIAIKRSLGKLTLEAGWGKAIRHLDFAPMPITSEHAERVEELPWHHRDPFDRLLIAQAQLEEHAFISADSSVGAYDVEVVW